MKNKVRMMVALLTLFCAQQTWGACALSVKDVQRSIDKEGAKKVLWAFGAHDDAHWASFTDCIQTAENEWLRVAVEVGPYRDGFVGEDLDLALGRALAVNAENVLRIAIPTYDYGMFCGMLDNDGPAEDAPYLQDLDARDRGLQKVKDSDLLTVAQECREVIQKTRDYIKSHPGNSS